VQAVVPIATSTRQSAQNIAFHEIGRQAIMADPDWCDGHYLERRKYPAKGLAVARMAAHVTYVSESMLQEKFGRHLQDREHYTYGFDADFRIESYLRHQGFSFVDRFDANSYLYLTRAMDYFDLYRENNGVLANAFKNGNIKHCLISFSTDWLYPTSESKKILIALNSIGADVSFVEIITNNGHDAFLLNEPEFLRSLKGFLDSAYESFKSSH
jgi:homoserine O-acetyltransferase